ncbi:unnamed protein product [Heterobilharzia americana]|nr:unnamed protein product [Heterobilharzia americana]
MVSSISAEEFQRFQSQLLDLREAQITANDARLRAEKRVRQLEEELIRTQTALNEAESAISRSRVEELKQENTLLRDKLLSTESSFQLQSSTLRAECHRLTTELDRLSQQLSQNNSDKPKNSQICQTFNTEIQHKSIQVDSNDFQDYRIPAFLAGDIEKLEDSLERADSTHCRLKETIEQLNAKVNTLENKLSLEINNYQSEICKLVKEKDSLSVQLNKCQEKVIQSEGLEKELRNQIDAVKRRSEKLNHELRRQLNRFLRSCNNNNGDSESVNLRKTSLHSSSSSLSSNLNITPTGSSTPSGVSNETNTLSVNGQISKDSTPKYSSASMLKNSFSEMPPGFFSATDFKALIDRMSEVQEENCTLRRIKKRLEADITAKSLVIQKELDNYLKSPMVLQKDSLPHCTSSTTSTTSSLSNQYSSLSNAVHSSNVSINSPSSSSLVANNPFSSSTWFPFMKGLSLNSDSSSPTVNTTTTTLSSVNLQTVNRLKLMCEELLTENIQLKEQLKTPTETK